MRDELDEEGIPNLHDTVTSDESDGLVPPRDYPQAATGFGTTAAEERRGESLAQRVAREERDVVRGETGDVGPLVAPGGEETADDEAAAVALEVDSDEALSAEEAAMHIVDEG